MSITLDVKDLRLAAGEAASVAVGGTAPPILGNVLIQEGPGGAIRFSATDLDTVLDRHVQAAQGTLAREPLKITVSARFLSAIAAKLPDGAQVALELENAARLKVSSGRARFTLPTLPVDDFPLFTEEDWAAEFELPAKVLARLIDTISFAASTEETRYYLNGLFLHAVDGMLRAAATDGHRLARTQIALPEGAESLPGPGVIVPRRALSVIRKLIDHMPAGDGDASQLVQIAVSARKAQFDFAGTVFTTKLIDGTFPDYVRVIPTGNNLLLKVDKAVLREAAERVATIASERTRALKVETAKDRVTLTVTSPESGLAVEELPADYAGDELTIGFNVRYLIEVLDRVEGDIVHFAMADAAAPTLITAPPAEPGAAPDTLFVLMPLRV